MSLNLGTMYAALALDPSNFNNTLNGLPDEAQAVFSKIQGIIGRAFSFEEVITFGKNSLKAFMEQENAVNAYSSALRNLGFEYQARTREANAFASEMQKITKYGDEMTVSAMAQGIKLGIDPSQIQQATKAAMVMAEKYGMDLPSAMMLLGRASQGQTQMLTRYGIVLDETLSAEEKFNQLLKMGADEFNLVTDAANTTEGRITRAMNAIGDTMELIGEQIANALLPLADMTTQAFSMLNSLNPPMQKMITTGAVMIGTVVLLRSHVGKLATQMLANFARGLSQSIAGMFSAAKASIAMNGGFKAAFLGIKTGAKTAALAMKGFFASLGPVGWAILAIEGLVAVFSLLGDAAEDNTESSLQAANFAYEQAKKAADQEQQKYDSMQKNIATLQQLQQQEKLTDDQQKTALETIDALVAANGALAGKIKMVNEQLQMEEGALDKVNKAQRKALKDAKRKEGEAAMRVVKTNYLKFQETASDTWSFNKKQLRDAIGDGQGGLSLKKMASILESGKIGDTSLSTKQLDALRELYNSGLQYQKIADEYNGLDKKWAEEDRKRKEEAKRQEEERAKKLDDDNWAAYRGYESKKQKMAYDEMSSSDKLKATQTEMQDLQEKIQAVEQGGVSPKEYQQWIKLKEQELDLQKKLKDLEKQVTEEKKRQADEAEREAKAREKKQQEDQLFLDNAEARHSGVFSEAEKRRAAEETDRQFRQLLNLGRGSHSEAARFAGNRKYQIEEQIAQNQADFERAKADAMADGTLDDQEKAYINSLIEARSKLQTELENWEGKLKEAESVDENATKEASEAVGAWSAEVLNAQLGGPRSTEKLIEKNTREQVRISRDMLSAMTTSETYTD